MASLLGYQVWDSEPVFRQLLQAWHAAMEGSRGVAIHQRAGASGDDSRVARPMTSSQSQVEVFPISPRGRRQGFVAILRDTARQRSSQLAASGDDLEAALGPHHQAITRLIDKRMQQFPQSGRSA